MVFLFMAIKAIDAIHGPTRANATLLDATEGVAGGECADLTQAGAMFDEWLGNIQRKDGNIYIYRERERENLYIYTYIYINLYIYIYRISILLYIYI